MSTITIAGFSSAVTFGIGEFASGSIGNIFLRASFQAVAHGVVQGQMNNIQGGKFWSGFASGSISSIASSSWQGVSGNFGKSGVGTIFFGTISGGAGAALTGGNFWQGAVTGLIVSGLNHAMHDGDENGDGDGEKPKPKKPTLADLKKDPPKHEGTEKHRLF